MGACPAQQTLHQHGKRILDWHRRCYLPSDLLDHPADQYMEHRLGGDVKGGRDALGAIAVGRGIAPCAVFSVQSSASSVRAVSIGISMTLSPSGESRKPCRR